jgi:small subunit ribosomal protein S4e
MHLKRQKTPKNWPITRKGTKYVVRPMNSLNDGIPLLLILRDMLKITHNRKETKKALNSGFILLNNQKIIEEKTGVCLFDTITLVPEKKYYKLTLTNKGKFSVEEIKEDESKYKISKIINKKILKGKKEQLNLNGGRNYISNIKCKMNDSVLINLKDKKIEKCIGLKEKAKAIVFDGKHIGEKGIVETIDLKNKMVELINEDKKKINVLIKHMMVID